MVLRHFLMLFAYTEHDIRGKETPLIFQNRSVLREMDSERWNSGSVHFLPARSWSNVSAQGYAGLSGSDGLG